jgi:hypothetical protein
MHLWLALSPHGYGHAAMTAPLVAELRRRRPGLRLTIQTALPRDFLESRYGAFAHVAEIPDFGFRMKSPTEIDLAASAAGYGALHADFAGVVAREAERLRAAGPDLVLANVPYVTIAAAARAGVPVVAFSSLNWADMVAHYLPDRVSILAQIRDSYAKAAVFLRTEPAQPMTLPNVKDIGTVARPGAVRRREMAARLGLGQGVRVGLIAYGGIDHRLPLERWPALDGWFWLASQETIPRRADFAHWKGAGLPFGDLSASVDLLVGKTGYGTFTEAGLAGIPVLYEARPDWPEAPALEGWLARHTRCLPAAPENLLGGGLPLLLQKLFSMPHQSVGSADGIREGADAIESVLTMSGDACGRS